MGQHEQASSYQILLERRRHPCCSPSTDTQDEIDTERSWGGGGGGGRGGGEALLAALLMSALCYVHQLGPFWWSHSLQREREREREREMRKLLVTQWHWEIVWCGFETGIRSFSSALQSFFFSHLLKDICPCAVGPALAWPGHPAPGTLSVSQSVSHSDELHRLSPHSTPQLGDHPWRGVCYHSKSQGRFQMFVQTGQRQETRGGYVFFLYVFFTVTASSGGFYSSLDSDW